MRPQLPLQRSSGGGIVRGSPLRAAGDGESFAPLCLHRDVGDIRRWQGRLDVKGTSDWHRDYDLTDASGSRQQRVRSGQGGLQEPSQVLLEIAGGKGRAKKGVGTFVVWRESIPKPQMSRLRSRIRDLRPRSREYGFPEDWIGPQGADLVEQRAVHDTLFQSSHMQ